MRAWVQLQAAALRRYAACFHLQLTPLVPCCCLLSTRRYARVCMCVCVLDCVCLLKCMSHMCASVVLVDIYHNDAYENIDFQVLKFI